MALCNGLRVHGSSEASHVFSNRGTEILLMALKPNHVTRNTHQDHVKCAVVVRALNELMMRMRSITWRRALACACLAHLMDTMPSPCEGFIALA